MKVEINKFLNNCYDFTVDGGQDSEVLGRGFPGLYHGVEGASIEVSEPGGLSALRRWLSGEASCSVWVDDENSLVSSKKDGREMVVTATDLTQVLKGMDRLRDLPEEDLKALLPQDGKFKLQSVLGAIQAMYAQEIGDLQSAPCSDELFQEEEQLDNLEDWYSKIEEEAQGVWPNYSLADELIKEAKMSKGELGMLLRFLRLENSPVSLDNLDAQISSPSRPRFFASWVLLALRADPGRFINFLHQDDGRMACDGNKELGRNRDFAEFYDRAQKEDDPEMSTGWYKTGFLKSKVHSAVHPLVYIEKLFQSFASRKKAT